MGRDLEAAWERARRGDYHEHYETFIRNIRIREQAVAHARRLGVPERTSDDSMYIEGADQ